MISHENKALMGVLAGLLVVLGCAKLALWPWLLRSKTSRYRRIVN